MEKLEKVLNDIFAKSAPKLPENAKKVIVQFLPWLNLVLGVLTLWSALALWHWAHAVNNLVNTINSLGTYYGVNAAATVHRLSASLWLSLVVLIIEAVLYIAAFPGTRDHKKAGWNLLFYALLINVVYGVIVAFTSYGGIGSLIGSLIGSAVGLYFLFQIRSAYLPQKSTNDK